VNGKQWYTAEVKTTRENREAIEYGLMEAGALGTETIEAEEEMRITGYFEQEIDQNRVNKAMCDALRIYNRVPKDRVDLEISNIPDRDWLAEWKKSWQPVEVGRFIIAPPWIQPPLASGTEPLAVASGLKSDRVIISINPGMAFGTGTHESTRLCLKAIEKHFRGGSFLDVGCGTGILAIAAAKMFPDARIEACDTDADAIGIAKENARLNGAVDRIAFRVGTVDEQTSSADLVCANLTATVIVDFLPSLLGVTCGRLMLSGILDSQVELVQSRLRELGATTFETDQDGEWIALVV